MADSGRYDKYSFLDVTVDDGIALIVCNRPEVLNASRKSDHKEFSTILRDIGADDDVRVAVITGKGRAFSVGGDFESLEELSQSRQTAPALMRPVREIVSSHIDCEKPIICALNGPALGAGLSFALLCDIIIMERQAWVADGHIRAGLGAGDGGCMIWPLAMGLTTAKKYLLTGDSISAEDAERYGLVSEIAEEGKSLERAMAIARRLADGPQVAIRFNKMALNQWLRAAQVTAFDFAMALEFLGGTQDEVRVAVEDLRNGGIGAIARESRTRIGLQ